MIFADIVKGGIDGLMGQFNKAIEQFHLAPDKALEIQQAAQQAADNMVVKLEEIAAKDRDSARQREMVVKDKTPAVLMYACTAGFFGILGYMLGWPVPTSNERILDMMLGSLGTAWIMGWAYYYGTSTGSASKQDLIAKLTRDKQDK